MILYTDTETRSATNIGWGVHRYVEDPDFKIILVTWAIDDEPVFSWEPLSEPTIPGVLKRAFTNADTVVMHNSSFDRRILKAARLADISPTRIHDTMIQAHAHALPGSLAQLSAIFNLGTLGKLESGKKLIKKFSNPLMHKGVVLRDENGHAIFNTAGSHPEEWLDWVEYGCMDVESMRALHKKMPKLNYPKGKDYDLWIYDQIMADRGFLVDQELARKAVEEDTKAKKYMNFRVAILTDNKVQKATQRDAFLDYINEGFDEGLKDLKSSSISQALNNQNLNSAQKELLLLRCSSSKNTAAKYIALLNNVSSETGRLHNTIQFMGASRTGRDAGRVFQPQNLMRPTMWKGLSGLELEETIEDDISLIKSGALSLLYEDPIDMISNVIRSVIVAPKGKKLCVSDLSNIEGRGLVWLANEEWKLEYFRKFDKGDIKFDNYVMAYARAMNVEPASVTHDQRMIGKVMELGLGYGGGVAAFKTFALGYGLNLNDLATAIHETADPYDLHECRESYGYFKDNKYHGGLDLFEFTACQYLKTQWRKAHPKVVSFWKALEEAFRLAIISPKHDFEVAGTKGKIVFHRIGPWAFMVLPSGRRLSFANPRIENNSITFSGICGLSKKWKRLITYGGRLSENAASAVARDVLFHSIPKIEEAGYEIIMRVHDEIVAEALNNQEYSFRKLSKIISTPHDWCLDYPLAATGFDALRYRGKD